LRLVDLEKALESAAEKMLETSTVGSKRVIAFYEPDSGNCAVQLVMWKTTDVNGWLSG
jgi:hypothetical protein